MDSCYKYPSYFWGGDTTNYISAQLYVCQLNRILVKSGFLKLLCVSFQLHSLPFILMTIFLVTVFLLNKKTYANLMGMSRENQFCSTDPDTVLLNLVFSHGAMNGTNYTPKGKGTMFQVAGCQVSCVGQVSQSHNHQALHHSSVVSMCFEFGKSKVQFLELPIRKVLKRKVVCKTIARDPRESVLIRAGNSDLKLTSILRQYKIVLDVHMPEEKTSHRNVSKRKF